MPKKHQIDIWPAHRVEGCTYSWEQVSGWNVLTFGGVHDKFPVYHLVIAHDVTQYGTHKAYKIFEVFDNPQEACDYANALCMQPGYTAVAV